MVSVREIMLTWRCAEPRYLFIRRGRGLREMTAPTLHTLNKAYGTGKKKKKKKARDT